jgi:hypothetical protein
MRCRRRARVRAVYLVYAGLRGQAAGAVRPALMDEDTVFATKPELAARMIGWFLDAWHRAAGSRQARYTAATRSCNLSVRPYGAHQIRQVMLMFFCQSLPHNRLVRRIVETEALGPTKSLPSPAAPVSAIITAGVSLVRSSSR